MKEVMKLRSRTMNSICALWLGNNAKIKPVRHFIVRRSP